MKRGSLISYQKKLLFNYTFDKDVKLGFVHSNKK